MKKKIIISISVVLVIVIGFLSYLYFKPLNLRTTDYTPDVNFSYTFHDKNTYDELLKIVDDYNKLYEYTDNQKICIGRGTKQMTFMSFDKKRITVNFSSLMYCAESDKFLLEQIIELNVIAIPYLKTDEDHFEYVLFNAALMHKDKNFEAFINLMGELAQEYASHSEE